MVVIFKIKVFKIEIQKANNPFDGKEWKEFDEKHLQMYKSQQMMQQLLTQLHPNIQFPTITRPEPFVPQPPPDDGDDAISDAANLRDKVWIYFYL